MTTSHEIERALCLIIVSSWLVVACSDSAKKIEVGGACILNSDCNQSLVCTMGKCHDACHTTADCPAGQSCITVADKSTVCQLPVEVHCVYDSDCTPPLTCAADQRCHNQCQSSVDCPAGQTCTTSKTCAEPNQVDSNNNLIPADGGVASSDASGSGGAGGSIGPRPDASADHGSDMLRSTGGANSTGGGSGGAPGTGGSISQSLDASIDLPVDAPASTGGTPAAGGSPATGGSPAAGGSLATGGTPTSGGTPATGGTTATGGATRPPDAAVDLRTPDATLAAPDLSPLTPDTAPDAPALEAAVDVAIDSPAVSAEAAVSDSPVGQDGAGPQTCKVNGECASVHCVDGYCCDKPCSGTCEACNVADLEGTCSPVPAGTDPATECPDKGPCASSCNGNRACSPVCGEVGAACGGDGDCNLVHCVDGYCCDSLCSGFCEACNVQGKEGTCSPVPAGKDPAGECDADPASTCGRNGYCDGTGLCQFYGAETTCNDGQDICTSGDHCNGKGACVGGQNAPNFTPCTVVTTPDYDYDICVYGKCISPGTCTDTSCNAPSIHFPLPDTNQRQCHDNTGVLAACPGSAGAVTCADTGYCGQDAQYGWDLSHAVSERFTRAGSWEPTVTDTVTGMMWQGCPAGLNGTDCSNGGAITHSFADAMQYCASSTWGGYSDWRLPDQFEVPTLVDFGAAGPYASAFPNLSAAAGVPVAALWTSDRRGVWVQTALTCGPIAFQRAWLDTTTGTERNCGENSAARTLCVRGTVSPVSSTRFARTGDWEPVVSDANTSLMWQGCAAGLNGAGCSSGTATTRNWHDSLQYCQAITWGGFDDWYLPNSLELMSIIDGALAAAVFDPAAFPATPADVFVSSTSYVSTYLGADSAWYFNFADGNNYVADKGSLHLVRCVRKAN